MRPSSSRPWLARRLLPAVAALLVVGFAGWWAWANLASPRPGVTSAQLEDRTLVLGVEARGGARAYPLVSLLGLEVLNDQLAGEPIVVTF